MKSKSIIESLLDTDLYKFTMWQVMLHDNASTNAVTEFVCRNTPLFPLAELAAAVEDQLDHLCELRFTPAELAYLAARPYFKPDFIEFLSLFHLQRKFISVHTEGDRLMIRAKGLLLHITAFEIFVLAIVNELYFRRFDQVTALVEGRARLQAKIALLRDFESDQAFERSQNPFEFFDFGTRRRFSRAWHEEVVATLAREVPQFFRGTSNVYLAMKYNLVPIGTMAHEHLQKHQGLGVQLKHSQAEALEEWAREYRGDLGIALTDVISMDAFLRDFDLYFTKLFDGMRHDSGDPIVWGEKALAHYKRMRVDARAKRLVFSDALDLPKAFEIYRHFSKQVMCGFGIGTWLSNDVGQTPLNVVMKLLSVNEQPVAKISDAPGKTLCENKVFLRYLCQVYQVDTAWLDDIEAAEQVQARMAAPAAQPNDALTVPAPQSPSGPSPCFA